MVEVGAKDGPAEFPDIGHDEATRGEMWEHAKRRERRSRTDLVPSSVQFMNCEDFGSLIILHTYVIGVSEGRGSWTDSAEVMYNTRTMPIVEG